MRISDWSSDLCSSDLQVHVGDLILADARSAFDGVPEHLAQARGIGPHARLAIALWQAIADFLKSLVDQLASKVDIHVVFEIDGNIRQSKQAEDRKSTRLNSSH